MKKNNKYRYDKLIEQAKRLRVDVCDFKDVDDEVVNELRQFMNDVEQILWRQK